MRKAVDKTQSDEIGANQPKIYVRPIPFLAGCCYPRKPLSNKTGIGLKV
jgi:hypothetical protein